MKCQENVIDKQEKQTQGGNQHTILMLDLTVFKIAMVFFKKMEGWTNVW